MKKHFKRLLAAVISVLVLAGSTTAVFAEEAAPAGGTIIWLSNLTAGVQYDSTVNYLTALCDELGYKFSVVYGDGFNDAAGNLQAVKNGMTNDTVGLIVSQDGGLQAIMEEYPDLYVVGYNTEMISVYNEGGENADVLQNDHFLGTIADGYIDGANTARIYFDICVERGFKKVAIVNFPGFAYPTSEQAAKTFVELVDEYNATAAEEDKMEIVGETTTLMFTPLEDSWFLDGENGQVDAIVAACAGPMFVFPSIVSAIGNGMCSPNIKMVSGGFDADASIVDSIGDSEDKIIASLSISPAEDPAYALVLLDNAITGNQYDDFAAERVDSFIYTIDTDAKIADVMSKSLLGTGDPAMAQIPVDMVVNELCRRNNPDATFAQLQEVFHDASLLDPATLADK